MMRWMKKRKSEITINSSEHSIEFVAEEHELRFDVIGRIRANFVHRSANHVIDPIVVGPAVVSTRHSPFAACSIRCVWCRAQVSICDLSFPIRAVDANVSSDNFVRSPGSSMFAASASIWQFLRVDIRANVCLIRAPTVLLAVRRRWLFRPIWCCFEIQMNCIGPIVAVKWLMRSVWSWPTSADWRVRDCTNCAHWWNSYDGDDPNGPSPSTNSRWFACVALAAY